MNRLRAKFGEDDVDKVKLRRQEYDLEMSLLDTRLKAMKESAKAKSIGEEDEAIRILKAKLAILICKEKLTNDHSEDEWDDKPKEKYKRIAADYTRQIVELRQQLENAMNQKYAGDPSIQKKGKKLLIAKERMEIEHAEYMENVTEEESAYLFTRLYENDQIEAREAKFSARPTKKLLAENFEKFSYGAGLDQIYSDCKLEVSKFAKTEKGRAIIDGYRRERVEILTSIDQITGEQATNAIKKMVATDCLPNCLAPIWNVLCLDANNTTFQDDRFVNFVVKPLFKAVTTSAANGIIKDAANITNEQVNNVQLQPRKVTYIGEEIKLDGKVEIKPLESEVPSNLYKAIRYAQQYAVDKFEQSLGMEDDRIYKHLPSHEVNIPLQGTKVHVSFSSRYEFLEYVPILAEEFKRLGIKFKLLSGNGLVEDTDEEREKAYGGEMPEKATAECGKEITIYPTHSFDPAALSEQARKILYQNSGNHPKADAKSNIRMSVRYGGFLCKNLMTKDGGYELDTREEVANEEDRDQREKSVDMIVDYFKSLKSDYEKGKLSKEQLIRAYCLGSKDAGDDSFDIYVFDDEAKMNHCVRRVIPRDLRHNVLGTVRLHLFGAYMIAVPKALQEAGAAQHLKRYKGNLLKDNMDKLSDEPW